MVVLLFGPPGCGKGTQAGQLAGLFVIPAISTGDMFRAECQSGSELGRKASAILASGGLVDDDLVNAMVASRIARPDCAEGFLLDGYPRTVQQAQFLAAQLEQQGLPEPVVIHLHVPEEVLLERLTGRRQCPRCGRIYHETTRPPRRDGLCDQDGAELMTRPDDREAVIRQRFAAYHAVTDPVLEWYGATVVHRIDGTQEPALVSAAIEQVIEPAIRLRPNVSFAAGRLSW